MDIERLAKNLAGIDALETWTSHLPPGLSPTSKKEVLALAEQQWLERMAKSGKLLLHPDVVTELETQHWVATDVQKRMVWASVLASDESPNKENRLQRIKIGIINKHGPEWWEDIYRRIEPARIAKNRLLKKSEAHGPALNTFLNRTFVGAEIRHGEREKALRMIPKQ